MWRVSSCITPLFCDSVTALDGKWMPSIMKTTLGLQWRPRSRWVPKDILKKYAHVYIYIYTYTVTYKYSFFVNVSVDIIGPIAFSDLSSSPCCCPSSTQHVLTQNPWRGKSRSKLCYSMHLKKLARLLKPTAKKSFIFTVGATRTFKIKCHPREVHNKPCLSLKRAERARSRSHHWRIGWSASCLWRWSLVTTLRTAKCGTSQSIGIQRNTSKELKCVSWWAKVFFSDFSSITNKNRQKQTHPTSQPFFGTFCTQRLSMSPTKLGAF